MSVYLPPAQVNSPGLLALEAVPTLKAPPFLSQAQTSTVTSTFLYPTADLTSPLGGAWSSQIQERQNSNSGFISPICSPKCPPPLPHPSEGKLYPFCCSSSQVQRYLLWLLFSSWHIYPIWKCYQLCLLQDIFRMKAFTASPWHYCISFLMSLVLIFALYPLFSTKQQPEQPKMNSNRVMPLLKTFQWFPISLRMKFQILTHNTLHALAPLPLLTSPLSTFLLSARATLGLSIPQSC